MTPEQERWAEAFAVIKMHGDHAEAFIADQRLALVDDPAGRVRWSEIAERVRVLREAEARKRT